MRGSRYLAEHRRNHRARHDVRQHGSRILASLGWDPAIPVVVVHPNGNRKARRVLAYAAGQAARREGRWDFASFPW